MTKIETLTYIILEGYCYFEFGRDFYVKKGSNGSYIFQQNLLSGYSTNLNKQTAFLNRWKLHNDMGDYGYLERQPSVRKH